MNVLYNSENEYQQHSQAIHSLAGQYHIKESLVREIYEKALKDLLQKARLRKYLLILVSRHVKDLLCKSGLAQPK